MNQLNSINSGCVPVIDSSVTHAKKQNTVVTKVAQSAIEQSGFDSFNIEDMKDLNNYMVLMNLYSLFGCRVQITLCTTSDNRRILELYDEFISEFDKIDFTLMTAGQLMRLQEIVKSKSADLLCESLTALQKKDCVALSGDKGRYQHQINEIRAFVDAQVARFVRGILGPERRSF